MYVFTYSSKKIISLAVAQTVAVGASIAAAVSVSAQTPPATSPAPQAIEKIEVTGSNIKRVESETSSLVQVIFHQ